MWEAHFAALKRYMDGEGDGDPNCPSNYVSKDTSPPLNLGAWRAINVKQRKVMAIQNLG